MNSSLDNLSDEDFKYLVEEFGSKNVELLKGKRCLSLLVYEKEEVKEDCNKEGFDKKDCEN